MGLAAQRTCEILGLKGQGIDTRRLAAAVERGLPPGALVRTVARADVTGKVRDNFRLIRVIDIAPVRWDSRLFEVPA